MADEEVPEIEVTKIGESKPRNSITIGWALLPGQRGGVPLIDGSPIMTDGKQHPFISRAQHQIEIGKPKDGKDHDYGVEVWGPIGKGFLLKPPPPVTPADLGADVMALYPAPAEPTGPIIPITSYAGFVDAWTKPLLGADYDLGGRILTGTGSGDKFFRGDSDKITRFRNGKVITTQRFLIAGRNISLGNKMAQKLHFQGGTPECLKLDPGAHHVYWDGLVLEDSPGQGVLTGSGSAEAVHHIRGINFITKNCGQQSNLDHGAYLAHIRAFLLANWLSINSGGYNGQIYPQAYDGHIVNSTLDGGVTRGGLIYGSEPGNPDATHNVRGIGLISTNCPSSKGYRMLYRADGCTVEDSMEFGNNPNATYGEPIFSPGNAPVHLDPQYVNRGTGDFRPRQVIDVRKENWGWLWPTDINDIKRGPHPGAFAKMAA